MDIYSTQVLNRVIDETPLNPAYLLNMFFPAIDTSDSESIMFDVVKGRRRIAPFVAPQVQGKVITEDGFETNSFAPAYIKDKRVFDPNKQFKRRAGEKLGGSLTPKQRLMASVSFALKDQLDMWTRRLEVMAAEVLFTGKALITGEDYPTKVVDFGRDPAHSVVLLGGDKWDQAGVNPLADIEKWAEQVAFKTGVKVTDVTMTPDVWRVIRSNENLLKLIDTQKRARDENSAFLGPMVLGAEAVRLVGIYGDLRLWVYSDFYIDPLTGLERPMLEAGSVLLASPSGVEGVRHFGAIRDLKAGIQPREYFAKSWEQEDPSVRFILGQSAPLLVPYNVNTTFGAKVL